MSPELSPLGRVVEALVDQFGDRAPEVLDAYLDSRPELELAAGLFDWDLWARPKQQPPDADWRSWGFLTGRGFGKTLSIAKYIQREVAAGRVGRIGLCAQGEDETIDVMVDGDCGLITTSPPWFKAVWTKGRVEWPNGARAFVYTPERPHDIRGPEHDLFWASELVAWPRAKIEETWKNIRFSTRKRGARFVWDSTPRRRHPLLRLLLERAKQKPELHYVVRGSTRENVDNIDPETLAEWEEEYGGTQAGDEELEGIFFDESDGALFKQHWLDDYRRAIPTTLKRRILSVDPAISMKRGTDATGISDLGLGVDDRIAVLEDLTQRTSAEVWGPLVVARYLEERCDCIVVERNRGGDLVVAVLRSYAKEAGAGVVVMGDKDRPRPHSPAVIYVREIVGRESKYMRAEAVAPLFEQGRAFLASGVDFTELEDEMTTFEPGPQLESPNRLDSVVHGVWELAELSKKAKGDRKRGFRGIRQAAAELAKPQASPSVSRGEERLRNEQLEQQRRQRLSLFVRGRGGGDSI